MPSHWSGQRAHEDYTNHQHCKSALLIRSQQQQNSFNSYSLAFLLLLCTRELKSGLRSVLALSTSTAAMKLGREEQYSSLNSRNARPVWVCARHRRAD